MLKPSPNLTTTVHASLEENLLEAKRGLRRHRGALLHKETDSDDEVFDVIKSGEIVERHVFRVGRTRRRVGARILLNVENLALYQ